MPSDSFHFKYHSTTLFYYLKYLFSHYFGDDVYEVWSDYDEYECDNDHNEELPPNLENEAHPTSHINASCTSLMRWLLGFFLLLQIQFHLSDRVLNMVFRFLRTFLLYLGDCILPVL